MIWKKFGCAIEMAFGSINGSMTECIMEILLILFLRWFVPWHQN